MLNAIGGASRRHIDDVCGSMVLFFGFSGRDVADGLAQPAMNEPVDPFERGILDRLEAAPRSTTVNDFGLVAP